MIKLMDAGEFRMFKSEGGQRFIALGKREFAWVNVAGGDVLVSRRRPRRGLFRLGRGQFRLYKVYDEPDLPDEIHLEINNGRRRWVGYLLPNGLPRDKQVQTPIEPTLELISAPKGRHSVAHR